MNKESVEQFNEAMNEYKISIDNYNEAMNKINEEKFEIFGVLRRDKDNFRKTIASFFGLSKDCVSVETNCVISLRYSYDYDYVVDDEIIDKVKKMFKEYTIEVDEPFVSVTFVLSSLKQEV